MKEKFDVHLEYVELYNGKHVYDLLLVDQDGTINTSYSNRHTNQVFKKREGGIIHHHNNLHAL